MLRLRLLIILFLFAISAEARRMNPDLLKPPANNQAQSIKAPMDLRCSSAAKWLNRVLHSPKHGHLSALLVA